MLRIESVSKRFRSGQYGVRDVSFRAHGGVLGLLGRNGAGKTTLMQMIATVTKPTAGRIWFRDTDVVAKPDELRHRLGYRRRTLASMTTSRPWSSSATSPRSKASARGRSCRRCSSW